MADQSSDLVNDHPQLAREWAVQLNAERLSLSLVTAKTGWARKAYWHCSQNEFHCWSAAIRARARGDSPCPFCWQALESQIAQAIARELTQTFSFDPSEHKIALPDCEGAMDVDILVPAPFGGKSLVVEYDSFFQHRCLDGCLHRGNCHHTRDRRKTLRLQAMGYVVVRIRELPLDEGCRNGKHHRRDVYVSRGAKAPRVVSLLLQQLSDVYGKR